MIVLLGATGYVGKAFQRALARQGAPFIALSRSQLDYMRYSVLVRFLKEAGYETAITGKWHLGSKPEEGPQKFGFDHGYGSLAGGCGPLDHRYKVGEFTNTWHRNGPSRVTG